MQPGGRRARTRAELLRHIKNNIAVSESGCWIWRSSMRPDGYGQVSAGELLPSLGGTKGRPPIRVHVALWRLLVDDVIPVGLHLHHICSVRSCCNPAHLELVTPAEHAARHCPQGACKHGHIGSFVLRPNPRRGPHATKRMCLACDRERQKRRRQDPAVKARNRAYDQKRRR